MKNGVNVAGVSEMMHEIREVSSEGVFAYDAEAQWTGGDTLNTFVNSALIGSVKSARGFQWRVTLAETAPVSTSCTREMLFTPEELALTGLGACAMLTMVKGATTCGRNIQSLNFLVKGTHHAATDQHPATLSNFDYRVEFDADSEEDNILFSEVLKKLSHHSPNHRTIVERNTIFIPEINHQIEALAAADVSGTGNALQVEMDWEYGFQLMVRYDKVRYTRVDQPKQAGGIDKGANPQEILMSAFASCLTRTFIQLAQKANFTVKGVNIRTTGYVDMRGMLGIDPTIPSKLQNLTLHFDVECSANNQEISQLMQQAVERSPVCRLLIEPQSVNLHLHRHSAQIIEFVSKG